MAEGTPVVIETRGADGPALAGRGSRASRRFSRPRASARPRRSTCPGAAADLRPGMFVTVRLLYGASAQATLIPASALWEDPRTGDSTVFVVEEAAGLVEPDVPGAEIPARAAAGRPATGGGAGRGPGSGGRARGRRGRVGGDPRPAPAPGEPRGGPAVSRPRPACGPPRWDAGPRACESLQREDLLETLPRQAASGGAGPRGRAAGEPRRRWTRCSERLGQRAEVPTTGPRRRRAAEWRASPTSRSAARWPPRWST